MFIISWSYLVDSTINVKIVISSSVLMYTFLSFVKRSISEDFQKDFCIMKVINEVVAAPACG